MSGVVRDFGTLGDMCMFIPAHWREGQGYPRQPSTLRMTDWLPISSESVRPHEQK